MNHFGGVAALRKHFLDRFRQHHRTMLSPRAAKSDSQIAFAFPNVMRNQIGKEAFDPLQEFAGLGERANVLADLWVRTVVRAQSRNKMRIGKKAHVKDEVGIGRNAIAIAEADDGY